MCGLSGWVSFAKNSLPSNIGDTTNLMLDAIAYRGPDDRGTLSGKCFSLGHVRLSILDDQGGKQPMSLVEGFSLVFNGEIYNAGELRKELQSQGCTFLSNHSDTEVIYQGFLHEGSAFFSRLSGMFALALYDHTNRKMYLARDRSGIKPLYYLIRDDILYFSSEPKSFKILSLKPNLSTRNLSNYFRNRVCIGTETLFSGVQRVLPGQLIEYSGELNFFPLSNNYQGFTVSSNDPPLKQLSRVLDAAIKRQVVADVPVGIYLSGGVDSSIISAYASNYGVKEAFTLSTDSPLDESVYASLVADRFGLKLNILKITASDFISQLSEWQYLNDDPIADPSAFALLLLSKYAQKKGIKVMLAGDGADELFGGYNAYSRFLFINTLSRILPRHWCKSLLPKRDPRLCDYLSIGNLRFMGSAHSVTFDLYKYIFKDKQSEYLNPDYFAYNHTFQYDSRRWLDIDKPIRLACDILPRTDRASMGASIEARVPFLDEYVVDFAQSLTYDNFFGKSFLGRKHILKRLAIDIGIPRSCVYRKKLGFELPLKDWILSDLRPIIDSKMKLQSIDQLDYRMLKSLYVSLQHPGHHPLAVSAIWHWLTLELWFEKWILA